MTLFDPGDALASNRPSGPIGPVGRAILLYLRDHDEISPIEAGRICHDLRHRSRGYSGCGVGAKTIGDRSAACCAYASADGGEALKRLLRNGYVERIERGLYRPVNML